MRVISFIVGILLGAMLPAWALGATSSVDEQDFPRPAMPDFVEGYMTMHEVIGVTVMFDEAGRVKSCDGQYGSSKVRQMTCHAIMQNWRSAPFAGKTVYAYVDYGRAGPVHVTLQPQPPYPFDAFRKGEKGRVVLAVTFDEKGRVSACRVASTSAPQDLAESTRAFVAKNWQSKAHAGETIDVPVTFNPGK